MWTRFCTFNIYLALLSWLLLPGCQSPEERRARKTLATLRFHLSALPTQQELREPVQIAGVTLHVEKAFFLDERSVDQAKVVDLDNGGFVIRIEFNDHGRFSLESVSGSNPGRQIAIFAQWGAEKLNKGSWLAAPRIPRRISDGVLVFTPAVSRQDADELVLGLNNVAAEMKKPLSW
jgi:hypothetical protein